MPESILYEILLFDNEMEMNIIKLNEMIEDLPTKKTGCQAGEKHICK